MNDIWLYIYLYVLKDTSYDDNNIQLEGNRPTTSAVCALPCNGSVKINVRKAPLNSDKSYKTQTWTSPREIIWAEPHIMASQHTHKTFWDLVIIAYAQSDSLHIIIWLNDYYLGFWYVSSEMSGEIALVHNKLKLIIWDNF